MKRLIFILIFAGSLLQAQNDNLKLTIRIWDKESGVWNYKDAPDRIDTSYYSIDQHTFLTTPGWTKIQKLETFTDFVETDSLLSKEHWFVEVNSFTDGYEYIWGVGIATQIIDYLIRRKLLSLGKE